MKGYIMPYGFKGFIPSLGKYVLFETEQEYIDFYNEIETD